MDYNKALHQFVTHLQEASNAHYAEKFPNLVPCYFEIMRGQNYDRVIKNTYSGENKTMRSVHSFVVRVATNTKALGQTRVGDIHKAASWKTPAKHPRGTIFSDDPGGYGCSVYSANYLTPGAKSR